MTPNNVAVVLTAIPLEAQAVLRHVDVRRREPEAGFWFEIGQFGSWIVAVGEAGAGNIRAATVAAHALTHLKPQIAAFVGIAGGVKDVNLGDVVVATKVYSYESGKEMPAPLFSPAKARIAVMWTSLLSLFGGNYAPRTADGFYPRPNV